MIKRSSLQILAITATFLIGGCQTIEQVPIDYLVPADVSFPPEVRKVGIVNNVKTKPEYQLPPADSTRTPDTAPYVTRYCQGDAEIATESMAEAVADNNYFDLVVICDSALRANDILPGEATLSRQEATDLARELGVDMLIALEGVQIKITRKIHFMPDWGGYWGTVDANIFPTVKLYLPNRNAPMAVIYSNDSIFWEDIYSHEKEARTKLISDEAVIKEASVFAGTIPVKQLIPHWESTSRIMYPGGSSQMRDAAFHARRKAWRPAFELWQAVYNREKKDAKLMQAALNIALYYEVTDDMDNALAWAEKAKGHAVKAERVDEGIPAVILPLTGKYPNYKMIVKYIKQLEERQAQLFKLKAQTDRFNME